MNYIKLYESYTSQKELEQLSIIIFDLISEKSLEKLESKLEKITDLEEIYLNEINNKHYNTLHNFIKDWGNLGIFILKNNDFNSYCKGSEACYIKQEDIKYIFLKEKQYVIDTINNILLRWDYDNKQEIINSISSILQKEYKKNLLHELQHAFDDWRSKGKYNRNYIGNSDNQERYSKLLNKLNSKEELKEEELEFISKHYKQYFNLPFETDARFTSAIEKTDFYHLDLDKSLEKGYEVYNIVPFKKVMKDFKSNMNNFHIMTEKEQKRTLRKLGQFYELEKEFVKKLNEKRE